VTVYVDDAFIHGDWGRWSGGGHLQADTADELHAFAARLGLKREWFQTRPGRPELDHYDLTRGKREQALRLGAVPESAGASARRILARIDGRTARSERCGERTAGSDGPAIERFARALESLDHELSQQDAEPLAEIGCNWATRTAERDEQLGGGRDVRAILALAAGVVAGAIAWRDASR
jgi:hypothetical protein